MSTTLHTAIALRVRHERYASSLSSAWSGNIAASLTDYRRARDIPTGAIAYTLTGHTAGFIVTSDGELIGLYSAHKGLGDTLVREAIHHGATRLDCFAGYLPAFYARHGFIETHREPNWTVGGPDVVYMALVDTMARAS